jgi:predicted DNA-binding transcriptional regulator YafY
MPVNKDFQRRLEILDDCFRRKQKTWTVDDLVEEINRRLSIDFGKGISKRSVYDDINYMLYDLDAPIVTKREGRKIYYTYGQSDFSIRNIPVKEEDIRLLRDAIDVISQVSGLQIADEVQAVVNRLENTVATNFSGRQSIIQFEKNGLTAGNHLLRDVFEAVKGRTVLKIVYQPFGRQAYEHVFHPYLLKEYRNRWFLIGRVDGSGRLTNLALDRIQKLKPLSNAFAENDLFDPDTYFNHMVGVTLPEGSVPETIRLRIAADQYPYIRTKPIHDSQRHVGQAPDGSHIVELHVVNNHELRSVLMGHAQRLVVEAPETLRRQIGEMYAEGARVYAGNATGGEKP